MIGRDRYVTRSHLRKAKPEALRRLARWLRVTAPIACSHNLLAWLCLSKMRRGG